MSNQFNNKYQEENAKAEQMGAGIAILWFLILFICLPIAILFPPSIFLMIAAVIWIIVKRQNNRK